MRTICSAGWLLYALLSVPSVFSQSVPSQAPVNTQIASIGTDQPQSRGFSLDSVAISQPANASPGSDATLIVRGAAMHPGEASITIFETTYLIEDIAADGASGRVKVKLPSDYDSKRRYSATITSAFLNETTPAVVLDTTTGDSGTSTPNPNTDQDQIKLPAAKDLDAQRKEWEKQSKQMEAYIKAGQRYAIDLARLQAVQAQIKQAQQPSAVRPNVASKPKSAPSGSPNNYCKADSAEELASIRLRRALMGPKEASDAFGRRIGRRFIVYQVTVENNNKNTQYMVHDLSVDLSRLFGKDPGTYEWAFSTRELSLLRGVPEKGQDLDPRNLTLHTLQGIGTVSGGISGLTPFADVFGSAVAAFNGPLITAVTGIAPDHTSTQLNRLSDSAFAVNTVVGKQQAKTFAVFVPEALFMTPAQQDDYWKDPLSIISLPALDFRNADLCVDGAFVTEVSGLILKTIAFNDPAKATANAAVTLKLSGIGIVAGDLLNLFGNTYQLKSIAADGSSAESDLTLPSTYDPKLQYPATLSTKTGEKTPAINLTTDISGSSLTLSNIVFSDPKAATPNAKVTVKLTGKNFVDGDTVLNVFTLTAITLKSISADKTSAEADITLPTDFDSKKSYPATLESKKSGMKTAAVNLAIPAADAGGTLAFSTISFSDPKAATPNAKVTVKLTGKNFVDGDTFLDVFTLTAIALKSISADKTSAEADLTLPGDFDPKKSYPATLESKKSGTKTAAVNLAIPAADAGGTLAFSTIAFSNPTAATPSAKVTVKLAGGNFVDGDTVLNVFTLTAVPLKNISAEKTSAEADITLPGDFDPKKSYPATLESKKSGAKTASVSLTVRGK